MCYLVITLIIILLTFLWLLLHKTSTTKLPPGPWPLPIIGNLHMLGSLPHRSLEKLAQKYGPIMSIKLGLVQGIVVSSPEAAELFLKQHDVLFASRPVIKVATDLFYGAKDIGFAPYGEYWRQVRKICTLHLLTVRKVESFEYLRRREIERMIRKMNNNSEKCEVVDIGKVVGELIEEITFEMIVGKKSKDGDKRFHLKPLVQEALELVGAINFADFLPFLAPFDVQGLTKRTKRASKAVDGVLENIISDHLENGHQQDILGSILTLMNNTSDEFCPTALDRDSVKAILLDLFSAGIDTTSYTITWALSALLKEPRVMKLLQQELDVIVGKERLVQESDLAKLPYLDMVVKETLRLYPVGPLSMPRESRQDVVVNGFLVPKNARIIINIWAISRDPNVWTDNAKQFYPERFINSSIAYLGQNFEYIPFGAGRRSCPGIQLGVVTFKMILAQMVHCFNWDLPHGVQPEDIDMTEKFGLAMGRANKLFVVPRQRAHF